MTLPPRMQLTDNAPTIIQKVCRLVLAFAGAEFAATTRAEISEAAAPVTRAVEKTPLFIMISLLQGSGVSRLSRRRPTAELWQGFDCRPAGRSRHRSCRPSPDWSGREARYSSAS